MASSGDSYEPFILPRAQADIESIVQFLGDRSPQGLIAWRERWEETFNELRARPFTMALAPESATYDCEVRQLLFKTRRGRKYRALFTVVGHGVFILTVRGPGQNLLKRGLFRQR